MVNIAKKRLLLCILLALSIIVLGAISSCNFYEKGYISSAPDYQRLDLEKPLANTNYVSAFNAASNAAPASDELNISNVVIFIYFQGESMPNINASTIAKFNGENNSLYDYYYDISYGKILISTFYASQGEGENTIYFAYQSQNLRSHYEAIKDKNSLRSQYERELLVGALAHFDSKMDYTGVDLDKNGDGYVDSISFVVSGNYENTTENWGGLMWPHSLVMSVLNKNLNKPDVRLNGKIVEYYTFNFFDRLTTGLVCHEFSHVLGVPDLYHYNRDKNYYQVSNWDLMHFECATPQFMTTYMRYKYLGAKSTSLSTLYASKISQVTQSGSFTLKPTNTVDADSDDFLAYKIEIDENESIWIEYRNNQTHIYDSELPGSGLIVYRVNNKATLGNQNGGNRSVTYPDEVYVYRPSVSKASKLQDREKANLDKAYISNSNFDFDSLGISNTTVHYDQEAIYLTNGVNTGIVITINSQTNQEISFNVSMPQSLSSANQVSKVEVLDKAKFDTYGIKDSNIAVSYKDNIFTALGNAVKVIITYKDGSTCLATMDNVKFVFDSGKIGVSQQATVRYSDSYNTNIVGYFNLIIRDGQFNANIHSYPAKHTYSLESELDLTGLILTITYASGNTATVAYVDAPQRFSYIGYDSALSGEYLVEVTYQDELGNRDTVIVPVSVIADITSIRINTKNSEQLISFPKDTPYDTIAASLPSLLEVIGTQTDGTSAVLPSTAYEVKPFSFSWSGPAQCNIIVQLLPDKNIESPSYKIYIVNATLVTNVTLSLLPKLDYRYGECLDLAEGQLRIETNTGASYDVSLEGFYDKFNTLYNCTRSGKQAITAKIYGFDITLNVKVGSDSTQLLTANNENIYVKTGIKNYLRVDGSITVSDFVASIASLFTVRVYYNDIYINTNAYKTMLISDKVSIHLFNGDNTLVSRFYASIIGDTDSNGILNADDIDNLAKAIVTYKTKNDNYDINFDGVYDIVDFVLLVEKVRG